MNRYRYLIAAVALVGTFTAAITVGNAVTNPAPAEAVATQYTVTNTWGPYNGQLPVGATVPCGPGCEMTAPGAIPGDEDATTVLCRDARDALLGGSAVVNLRTPGHPATSNPVLNLNRLGAFWDPEIDRIGWGSWILPTGRTGWNSVTIKVTCLVHT